MAEQSEQPRLGREQAIAHAGEIARTAAAEDRRDRARGMIGRALEDAPQSVAQVAVRQGLTESSRSRIAAGSVRGAGEPLGQQPRTAGRHRAVDGMASSAAVALAGQGAGQFEIGAGRRIDGQRRAAEVSRSGGLSSGRLRRSGSFDIGDSALPRPCDSAAKTPKASSVATPK
jgi:hypothetical protein